MKLFRMKMVSLNALHSVGLALKRSLKDFGIDYFHHPIIQYVFFVGGGGGGLFT